MRYSSLILLAACGFTATQAQAQTTITFDGEVTDQTCTATINGQSAATVTLPTVKASLFTTPDSTAGATHFTLNISGCSTPTTTSGEQEVKVKFLGASTVTNANGDLVNTAATQPAGGVAVQVLDSTTKLNLQTTPAIKVGELSATTLSASKEFTAQYVSDFGSGVTSATAGKVTATIEYTLSYL